MGGTFNPIHVGHLSVAQQVAEKLDLDEVILVPSGSPPHKSSGDLAPAADRLEMTNLATCGLARLSVSDAEIRREGVSYTIDTVNQLRQELGGEHFYCFIIGADTVAELPTWHRAAELLKTVNFAVATRPGCESDFEPVERELGKSAANRLRRALLDIEPSDASSTEIRRRAADDEDLGGMVRANVAAYIKRKGLYRK
jgi:nicotinate-nucleotide adenylyltransferase